MAQTKTRRPRRTNMLKQIRNGRMRAAAEGSPTPVAFFWDDPELLTVDTGDKFEIHFNDMIDAWFGISAAMITEALVAADGRDVLVHLNSPGGMVFEGLSIHSQLKQYSGNITVRVEGLAASAASFVMLAADQVLIEPGAMVMIHDACNITIGNAADHRKEADLLDKISNNIAALYAGKAGDDTETWRAAMIEETWYTGQEAVDAGLADAIVDEPATDSTAAAHTDWRGVFDLAPRRPVDLTQPPPTLPPGLETLDLGAVAAMVSEWRGKQTGTQKTTGSANTAADRSTTHDHASFLNGLKGLRP